MIKIISFDIGGTLLKSENNNNQDKFGLKELSNLLNLPYDKVRTAYKEIFQRKKGSLEELTNNFCNILGITASLELLDFFHNKFFKKGQNDTILPEDIILIKNLKLNGYKVILFSNSCFLLNNESINKIASYVDKIFYSYDIGYTKDDEESYRYIEKIMQVHSNEILHIGDTLKSDYNMPKQNGWKALYYGKCDDKNVNSITSLTELYKILNLKYNRFKEINKVV